MLKTLLAPLTPFVVVCALLVGAAVSLPTLAVAQDPIEKAKAAFADAREKARTGDLPGALDAIIETERYMKHPTVSLLKARVLRQMFLLDRAKQTLDSIETGKLKRNLRAVYDEELDEVNKSRATRGHLKVNVEPQTATISVAGQTAKGTFDAWVTAGNQRVEISATGFLPAVRPVTVEVGQLRELTVKLRSSMGSIRLTAPGGLKGVELALDGQQIVLDEAVRAGEVTTLEAPMGAHEVVCVRGKLRDAHVIKVEAGGTVSVSCDAVQPSGAGKMVLGWGGVATGLAMAGYGVWGIASYFSDTAIADERLNAANPDKTPEGLVRGGGVDTNKHWGGALYMASGVAVGVASYLFLLREPSSDSAWRQPVPGDRSWQPERYVASQALTLPEPQP